MDNTSLKILKILQEKARIPNVEIARLVGLAPSAVLERNAPAMTSGRAGLTTQKAATPQPGLEVIKLMSRPQLW